MPGKTIIVSKEEMEKRFTEILRKEGFTESKAIRCAEIFTMNSVDGIYTHGVNRFAKFVKYIQGGFVKKDAVPSLQHAFGSIEQWNGNLGPGPLNAEHATLSAMRLAKTHGIGCVALSNTNHWMRGGAYAWQAAKEGFVLIAWTNTTANMPAWGGMNGKLGNNPLVVGLPYATEAIVLDMAMSQYSMGAMELAAMKNENLPVDGGFDAVGKLTNDPAAILATRRLLPTGYWKGSGLALLLDILAAVLSAGLSTAEISRAVNEYGVCQVFVAIDLSTLKNYASIATVVENIIADYHQSVAMDESKKVSYPGERVLKTREKNLKHGIPVQEDVWKTITDLCNGTTGLPIVHD